MLNPADRLASASRNVLWVFGLTSLLAVLVGAAVMAQADIPPRVWIRNPIAWAVAAALVLACRVGRGTAMLPIAIVVVALSLFGEGQQGVHRWLELGPVQINAAALVLPAAVLALSRVGDAAASAGFSLIAILLAWQPDLSQLVGFGLAALVLAVGRRRAGRALACACIVLAFAVVVCLARPDPLAPVAHVEGIFGLAWSGSRGLAIVMGLSIALAALSPLLFGCAHPQGPVAPLALAVYLATTSVAFLFGAFPVPLAGYGLSFVIGWWLGVAALCAR